MPDDTADRGISLGELARILQRVESKLDALNGSVQAQAQRQATADEWQRGHENEHTGIEAELHAVRERTNSIGLFNGVLAIVAAAFAALAGAFGLRQP